jgi:quinol monooxygenase YgiN
MFARFTELSSKDRQKAESIGKESILPAAKQQKGYRGVFLATNREGEGVFLSLWNSEADLEANEQSGYYQEQVNKLKPYLTKPTVRHIGEVTAQEFTGKTPKAARLTITPLKPGTREDAIKLAREVLNAARKEHGFVGWCGVVTEDNKAAAISFWDSEESMKETTGRYLADAMKRLKEYAAAESKPTTFDAVVVHEVATPAGVR